MPRVGHQHHPDLGGTDDIVVTVLNTFQAPYSAHILGMDYVEDDQIIVFNSNTDNKLFMCDPDDGTYVSELALTYTGNPSPFGNCWKVDAGVTAWVNDWSASTIAVWDGSSWSSISNPAANLGRGMDFEDPCIWETNSSSAILRFEPGGAASSYSPGVPSQMSGLCVFPYETSTGVMVTCYNTHQFFFYEFDGSSLNSLGVANCPTACNSSLGLTYSESRDTYFWSYSSGSGYTIAELDIEINVGLTPSTWAGIKTAL